MLASGSKPGAIIAAAMNEIAWAVDDTATSPVAAITPPRAIKVSIVCRHLTLVTQHGLGFLPECLVDVIGNYPLVLGIHDARQVMSRL
jgi:hypothetical protein